MKRKQDQTLNISPGSRVTNKRTKEINYYGNRNSNEKTVSDGSSANVESERVESSLNSNEYNLRSKNPPVVADADAESDGSRNSLKRLQQPPAYINPNLMKIKLESDYVPIVAVKHESPTGDENQEIPQSEVNNDDEDKKVDTLSLSVDSSKNNIKSEFSATDLKHKVQSALNNKSDIKLNADELQHLLNVIQSSLEKSEDSKKQQQEIEEKEEEKEVVKVASDEKETQTENKETEKEIIAELEERINKYTQKVISLHREKAEIQTTLQTQIHQLNLVIGPQQTQIHHLNLALSQKLDETNRLNSQLNHQQNEIALLNKHKDTVKKQEQIIHNLTSEIKNQKGRAKKQKNNLKLNPQVQKPVISASVKTNQFKIHKIGELPAKVLSRIFTFLDIQSLKQSRFVCRHWKQEAGKILLSKYYLICGSLNNNNDDGTCESALQSLLTNSYSTTSVWSKDGQKTLELLQKSLALKSSVRVLKYNEKSHTGPWDSENLYEILKLLPNLQVLDTNMLTLSPSQKWLGDVTSFSNGNPIKLELFIRKLQTLKKLKLDFVLGRATSRCLFTHQQRFSYIKNVEIHAGGMIFMSDFFKHSVNNYWTITRFSLNLNDNYDIFLIRKFLVNISSSLLELKLILNKEESPSSSASAVSSTLSSSSVMSNFEPWKDDWLIPIELDKLETLEIVSIHPLSPDILIQLNHFMLKSIISALQLRSLKKLVVPFIPWNWGGVILNWNSHESAAGRKLISQSLEELELLSNLSSTSTGAVSIWKVPVKLWPHLKSLKCSWKNPESFDISILSELKNLERIQLTIGNELEKENNNKDGEKNHNRNSGRFQLRDFKNLKGFCLKVPRHQNCYKSFADSLVENDLAFMKNLQCLRFHRVVLDEGPLKLALGSNVPVIFTK